MFIRFVTAFAVMTVAASDVAHAAQDPKTLEIGSPAPDFNLPGIDGRNYSLKDFASAKILVIVFTCNHCPTAQAYEHRIMKLDADYRDKGVKLVAINPNDPLALRLDELGYTDLSDSFEEMKIRAAEHGFKFPYLYDGDKQEVSRAYGVQATPHVFIFDADRKLRYVGRVDDSEVKQVKSQDAQNAIEALLAGKTVPVPKTRVFGCSTKWSDKREDARRSIEKWNAEPVDLKPLDAETAKMLAQNDSKKLRLVNFWATWCGPCVVEMPELVTMNRMYRGRPFEMITISMDSADKKDRALEKLKELHVSCTNYLYSDDDRDKLADAIDKDWSGALPHTVLIAPGGKIIFSKTGQIDPLDLKRAIVGYLGRTY